MAGCLSPSGDRSDSTLVVENRRETEQEVRVRFEDGDVVLFQETFVVEAGGEQRASGDLSRGAVQATLFVELVTDGGRETVYEDGVPGGLPEYRIVLRPDDIEVLLAEN